jgi:hypothetical protein
VCPEIGLSSAATVFDVRPLLSTCATSWTEGGWFDCSDVCCQVVYMCERLFILRRRRRLRAVIVLSSCSVYFNSVHCCLLLLSCVILYVEISVYVNFACVFCCLQILFINY